MTPRKPKGGKKMEKMLNLRVSPEFMEALEEAKWGLRMPVAEVVREAVVEYIENHLSKENLAKARQILMKAPEGKSGKRGGK